MGGNCDRRNVGFKCEGQEKRDFSLRKPTHSSRKTIRDAPVETTGVQKTHKIRARTNAEERVGLLPFEMTGGVWAA